MRFFEDNGLIINYSTDFNIENTTMHRQHLINLLNQYKPLFSSEKKSKEQMLDWLDKHADCFSRTCLEGHFTASAFIVNYNINRVLLMHHAKLNIWLQPGGHCDGEWNLLGVAKREAQEETGISEIHSLSDAIFDIDVHPIGARKNEPAHTHFDVRFLFRANDDLPLIKNNESLELGWFYFNKNELPTEEESILRMIHKVEQNKVNLLPF